MILVPLYENKILYLDRKYLRKEHFNTVTSGPIDILLQFRTSKGYQLHYSILGKVPLIAERM